MKPGSTLFNKNFKFRDGSSGPKLLLILGLCEEADIAIFARTTSQAKKYRANAGCQPYARFPNFYLPTDSCFFEKPTWICLDELHDINYSELLQKRFNEKVIHHIGDLDTSTTRKVQDCAVRSPDISYYQETVIRSSFV